VRAVVLAGGSSSRYEGKPKGLERVGGERILDHVVAALTAAAGEAPTLVANAPDAGTWAPGLHLIRDPRPNCGSLGGIFTAVTAGPGPVLVAAWDMPFLTVELLQALAAGAGPYDVFLPESEGRRGVEPLCGVYGPQCRDPIARQLDDEDYRAIGFHGAVRMGTLPLDAVRQFGDPKALFFNVNAPEDLDRAEEMWRARASSR